MKGKARMPITAPRTTRESESEPRAASAMITFVTLGSNTTRMAISITSGGSACEASTNRCAM